MIGKISGVVDLIEDDHCIIDVNGVGYMIFCSSRTLSNMKLRDVFSLFIETYVRENNISLFGFNTSEEKTSFNILQTVSGVGTRVALAILSSFTLEQLWQIIAIKDTVSLKTVPGVGPRLADRMLVELKDKVPHLHNSVSFQSFEACDTANDAISALVNLGMSKNDAIYIVNEIIKEAPDISIDNLIRMALQKRSRS